MIKIEKGSVLYDCKTYSEYILDMAMLKNCLPEYNKEIKNHFNKTDEEINEDIGRLCAQLSYEKSKINCIDLDGIKIYAEETHDEEPSDN